MAYALLSVLAVFSVERDAFDVFFDATCWAADCGTVC